MKRKIVLIIEDELVQKLALQMELENRGFKVLSADDIESARELLRKFGQDADVAVVDMMLEPSFIKSKNKESAGAANEKTVTGADLCIEYLCQSRTKSLQESTKLITPEFIILSAHNERIDYYEKAIDLGVAAYLLKSVVPNEAVISHIRALAIRHALKAMGSTELDEIMAIAENSSDRFEAIAQFCEKILVPEFEAVCGAPFVILLGAGHETFKCGGEAELPDGFNPAYSMIQRLAHGQSNLEGPFIFENQSILLTSDSKSIEIYQRLDSAVFLPYCVGENLRLTIGILKDTKNKYVLSEEPQKFGKILDQHLHASILEHWIDILTKMT